MEHTYFSQLSSEDKVADLKARIINFKHKHSTLYPEIQEKEKKKEEMQNRDDRLRSLFARS